MPRPQKQRCICSLPRAEGFAPQGCGASGSVNLTYDEYEAIRLLDHMQMTQEQCAAQMMVARATVTAIYDAARRKVAEALVCGRELVIEGGDFSVCEHGGHCCGRCGQGERPCCRDCGTNEFCGRKQQ